MRRALKAAITQRDIIREENNEDMRARLRSRGPMSMGRTTGSIVHRNTDQFQFSDGTASAARASHRAGDNVARVYFARKKVSLWGCRSSRLRWITRTDRVSCSSGIQCYGRLALHRLPLQESLKPIQVVPPVLLYSICIYMLLFRWYVDFHAKLLLNQL